MPHIYRQVQPGQACMQMYLLLTCDQQLGLTDLLKAVKTSGSLSPVNNSLQHLKKCKSLGKGLTG